MTAFCGETVRVAAAGRTDTGVHALGQVIHIDLTRDWPSEVVRDALNAHLTPEPIAVLESEVAPPDFHARFSATGRRYVYRILARHSPPALDRGRVWHVKRAIAAEAMHAAAQALVGQHDPSPTFRDAALPGQVAGQDHGCRHGSGARARRCCWNLPRARSCTARFVR